MSTYKDVISRVKTGFNRGIWNSDDRLSSRYIMSVALSKRERVLKQEQEKKGWDDMFALQVIPCMELIEVDQIECECLPASARGCKVLRTKNKIPKPIKDMLYSVSFLDGTLISPDKFNSYKSLSRLAPIRAAVAYYLVNEYIYLINEHLKKYIRVEAIFQDPAEVLTVGCSSEGTSDVCCGIYTDISFPVPNGLLDSIVALTIQEIAATWQYGVNDLMNDGVQQQPAQTSSRRAPQQTEE